MSYAAAVLADNPYCYWKLDETTGTNADDASTNNRDATYTNSPTLSQDSLVPTDPGKSVSFSAVTDHVVSNFLLNTSPVTIECWVSVTTFPTGSIYGIIVGFINGYDSGVTDKNLFVDSAGTVRFHVFDGADKITAPASSPLSLSTAYHVAGTHDGTTARCYVNGVQVGTVSAGASYTGFTVNNIFISGNTTTSFLLFRDLACKVDEVAIWNSALSATRIMAHYSAGLPALRSQHLDYDYSR